MNIGSNIQTLRESKQMTIEELASLIQDSVENVAKYEANELEPSLDKKLALAQVFDVPMDTFSFRIDRKGYGHQTIETVEESTPIQEERIQETPIAQSQIVYTPNVFDEIFKRDYRNFVVANLFSCLIYVVWGLFFYFGTLKVLGVISLVVSVIFIFRFIQKARQYKRLKADWVEEFVGQTRVYTYYQDHMDVSKPDETTQTTFYYNEFLLSVENSNYLISSCVKDQRTIMVIDKNDFQTGSFSEVKEKMKSNSQNYVDYMALKKEKNEASLPRSMDILSWVMMALAIMGIAIVSTIIELFTQDTTLALYGLTYGLALIFPIASIVFGIILNKKYKMKRKKNIITGIVMVGVCILLAGYAAISLATCVKANNQVAYETIESRTEIDMPDTYYTVYRHTKEETVTHQEESYTRKQIDVIVFGKEKELQAFLKDAKASTTWSTKQIDAPDFPFFSIATEVKTVLTQSGYTYDDTCDLYTICALEEGQYLAAMYYEQGNYMLLVTYTKNSESISLQK